MAKIMWKAKAEAMEDHLKLLEAEVRAQKEIIGAEMGELMKLQVVNASFQERLRLVKIAASQEGEKD